MVPEMFWRMSNFLLLLFFSLKVVSTSCEQHVQCSAAALRDVLTVGVRATGASASHVY